MQEANYVKGRLAKVYEQNVNMFIIKNLRMMKLGSTNWCKKYSTKKQ